MKWGVVLEGLKRLQDILGYSFKNINLLKIALTHTSYAHEAGNRIKHNERMEFLGDTILNLAITDRIYNHKPEISEGNMSKIRATIICEECLFEAAIRLKYDEFIMLGKGEEKLGGSKKPSILSDAFEAVIAAIYLDSNFETAKDFIIRVLGEKTDEAIGHVGQKDYKTRLQEVLQSKSNEKISYKVIHENGPDHMKEYEVEVYLGNKVLGLGKGSSKKDAEQNAAKEALKKTCM